MRERASALVPVRDSIPSSKENTKIAVDRIIEGGAHGGCRRLPLCEDHATSGKILYHTVFNDKNHHRDKAVAWSDGKICRFLPAIIAGGAIVR
jgi:hypothetical protein